MRGYFRILVVDDDDNILRSLSSMLKSPTTYIDTANNSTQALNKFQQLPYNLALLDMNMPDFDHEPNKLAGIRLLEKLREIDPTLPIVILTGEDEATVKTMLSAKNLPSIDMFMKNASSSGTELQQKIDTLLHNSKVSVSTKEASAPVLFQRNDLVNLQGVITHIDSPTEGWVFIKTDKGVTSGLPDKPWLARVGYGMLREEPVDIIGVQHNKFVVIGIDNILFIRDFYRNDILVYSRDLEGLNGKVVDVNQRMKRHGVKITSPDAPDYLTTKKFWQAVTEDDNLLALYTEIDIIGELNGKLKIRPHQTTALNQQGQEIEFTKAAFLGQQAKIIQPIDEEDKGVIAIISEDAPPPLTKHQWQATNENGLIFIPGEVVNIVGVENKKLIIEEMIDAG